MDKQFWLEKWQRNEIGFHQDEINPWLVNYWDHLALNPRDRVFVPLCGKSLDMLWLCSIGHDVIGVEISQRAVEDFFTENNLKPECSDQGKFIRYESDNLTILCGDFFDLEKNHLRNPRAVYDRAALIALPESLRRRYIDHLNSILSQKTEILLVTLEYPPDEMDGPPFPVTEDEVREQFSDREKIKVLGEQDVLDTSPRFKERGLTSLIEKAYRIL